VEREEGEIKSSPLVGFERRKQPRFSIGLPIEYRRMNSSKTRPGHTVSVSEDGLMVSFSEQIDIGENLEMRLYFSRGVDLNTITTIVQVIWVVNEEKEDGLYRYGVNFIDISPVDMDRLKNFLHFYADLKTPAKFKDSVGGCLNPHKVIPPNASRQPAKINPSISAFLTRLFSFEKWANGKKRKVEGVGP
jgi:hypothetical protein